MKNKYNVSGISKFLLSTLVAASAMTASAFAAIEVGDSTTFSSVATEYLRGDSECDVEIKFKSSFETTTGGDFKLASGGGKISFTADEAVNIYASTNAWRFISENENARTTFVVGKNVTLSGPKGQSIPLTVEAANLELHGKIQKSSVKFVGGEHLVSSSGAIACNLMSLSGLAQLTVKGSINLSQKLQLGDSSNSGGKLIAENAYVSVSGTLGVTLDSNSSMEIKNSTLSNSRISNKGTITVYGNSTINAGTITGNKIVVAEGATLTIASSLLDWVDNSANANGGNVLFGSVNSNVTLEANKELTVIVAETGSVQLSTAAEDIVVSKAEALDVATVSGIDGNVVAAWDFEITNENASDIEVSATIASGLDVNTIKIWHGLDDGSWELLNEKDGFEFDYNAADGKLTFSTNSFSPIAISGAVAAPEPSAFGLLAGLGALALVASRRRRTKKA